MGGNASFDGVNADKIVIKSSSARELYLDRISLLFSIINAAVKSVSGTHLWGRDACIEDFTAGSTTHLFNPRIDDTDLIIYKDTFGDIDLQIDVNRSDDVLKMLREHDYFGSFQIVGWSKSVDTIVTMWYDPVTKVNMQVDLEEVEFENGLPNEWSRFSRSSSWEDIEQGIKGFAHKYIFRAMTAVDLQRANVQMKTKVREAVITPWVFSPKGLRRKYEHIDKTTWREIPTSESYFERDLTNIYEHFFDAEPFTEELEWMWSYTGVVGLIHSHIHCTKWKKICDGMANVLWGKGAQSLIKDDYHEDLRIKLSAYDYLLDYLDQKMTPDVAHLMVSYYMQAYGVLQND